MSLGQSCAGCRHAVMPDQASSLFLSHIQPHKPITAQRLTHWIKGLLKVAGIDTKVLKIHSVRRASLAAMGRGVPLSDILSTANWSRNTPFKRCYYRLSADDKFATNVLSSWTDKTLFNLCHYVCGVCMEHHGVCSCQSACQQVIMGSHFVLGSHNSIRVGLGLKSTIVTCSKSHET